jgi:hypothetical protein
VVGGSNPSGRATTTTERIVGNELRDPDLELPLNGIHLGDELGQLIHRDRATRVQGQGNLRWQRPLVPWIEPPYTPPKILIGKKKKVIVPSTRARLVS